MSDTKTLQDKSILLIITGGIAAYKSLELIRGLRKNGANVRAILTKGGEQFVTPLSVSALCEHEVYTDLWSLKDETEMGHIRLSREADLIIVAPATANIMAQMANGMAADLATTCLLASDKTVMIAPAMNYKMWEHPATQENLATLKARDVHIIEPTEGDMACGEHGIGRMAEPEDILSAVQSFFFERPLEGYSALVTAGPTYEPLDPVRFIGNRSSGKQGYAIATALALAGANVTLISGPTSIPAPANVTIKRVETAEQMLEACEQNLPADIAICTAAVSDWRATNPSIHKIKKQEKTDSPALSLTQNPDILHTISSHKNRPKLVIGFAAETENLIDNAKHKLTKKSCDLIVANEVGADHTGQEKTFGQDKNHVYLVTKEGVHDWEKTSKNAIAEKLIKTIIEILEKNDRQHNAAE